MSPSLFSISSLVISPVTLLVMVWISVISSGRRRWRQLTNAFLLVMMTPDLGLAWLTNAGEQLLGRVVVWASDNFAQVVHGIYSNQAEYIG